MLAFFAASDGIVVENLGVRFLSGTARTMHENCCLMHRLTAEDLAVSASSQLYQV